MTAFQIIKLIKHVLVFVVECGINGILFIIEVICFVVRITAILMTLTGSITAVLSILLIITKKLIRFSIPESCLQTRQRKFCICYNIFLSIHLF